MTTISRKFHAMGTECEIIINTLLPEKETNKLAELAEQRVRMLEANWTRFSPESSLSKFNKLNGKKDLEVNTDLFTLLETMQKAWEMTKGAYDPTVIKALRHHGYTDTLENLTWDDSLTSPVTIRGLSGMKLDRANRTVTLPRGIEVDPGGIGKGLAADIIVEEFTGTGIIEGILVNLGGDIVLLGSPSSPNTEKWAVMLSDQKNVYLFPTSSSPTAIATSSPKSRRWGSTRHHVINPKTGQPAESPIETVTVTANNGWEAEAWTTAAILAGHDAPQLLQQNNLNGSIHWVNGTTTHINNFENSSETTKAVAS